MIPAAILILWLSGAFAKWGLKSPFALSAAASTATGMGDVEVEAKSATATATGDVEVEIKSAA